MINFFKDYLELLLKYQYNKFLFILCFIIIPLLLSAILHFFVSENIIIDLYKNSGTDFITLFSIINWFLLSGISIILASWKISKEKLEELKNEYKIINIKEYISLLKKVMLYDILFIFIIIIIFWILVSICKVSYNIWISFISIYFLILSIIVLMNLIKSFITYEKWIDLKFE